MKMTALTFATSALVATSANAGTFEAFATEWGTIRNDGPRDATSGNRFLNAQNTGDTANDSDAYLRFDITALKASIPVGEVITDVDVIIDDAPAGFSAPGGVELWWFSDDSVAITNGQASDGPDDDFSSLTASPLVFGDFTASPGTFGTQALADGNETYSPVANGEDNVFDIDGTGAGTVLDDAINDNVLSFVVLADSGTAATYKGNDFGDATRPRIVITTDIPEPSSLALLGLGGLLVARRRRG